MRLTDDYQYEPEEEEKEEKEQQIAKKNHLKNQQNMIRETGINYELFEKHFTFRKPSIMLKSLYKTNDKKNNNKLVNIIKSGLSDLKNEIENMSEEEK